MTKLPPQRKSQQNANRFDPYKYTAPAQNPAPRHNRNLVPQQSIQTAARVLPPQQQQPLLPPQSQQRSLPPQHRMPNLPPQQVASHLHGLNTPHGQVAPQQSHHKSPPHRFLPPQHKNPPPQTNLPPQRSPPPQQMKHTEQNSAASTMSLQRRLPSQHKPLPQQMSPPEQNTHVPHPSTPQQTVPRNLPRQNKIPPQKHQYTVTPPVDRVQHFILHNDQPCTPAQFFTGTPRVGPSLLPQYQESNVEALNFGSMNDPDDEDDIWHDVDRIEEEYYRRRRQNATQVPPKDGGTSRRTHASQPGNSANPAITRNLPPQKKVSLRTAKKRGNQVLIDQSSVSLQNQRTVEVSFVREDISGKGYTVDDIIAKSLGTTPGKIEIAISFAAGIHGALTIFLCDYHRKTNDSLWQAAGTVLYFKANILKEILRPVLLRWMSVERVTIVASPMISFFHTMLARGVLYPDEITTNPIACTFCDPAQLEVYTRTRKKKEEIGKKDLTETSVDDFFAKVVTLQPYAVNNEHSIRFFVMNRHLTALHSFKTHIDAIQTDFQLGEDVLKSSVFFREASSNAALTQHFGTTISETLFNDCLAELQRLHDVLEDEMNELVRTSNHKRLDFNAKADVGEFIQSHLALERFVPDKLRKTKKSSRYACTDEMLRHLEERHPFVCAYRKWSKLHTSMSKFWINSEFTEQTNSKKRTRVLPPDVQPGRRVMQGVWNFLQSPSMRFSCTSPSLQCVAKCIDHKDLKHLPSPRSTFVGRTDEHVLIAVDYRTIEFRIACALLKTTVSGYVLEADPFALFFNDFGHKLNPPAKDRSRLKVDIYALLNRHDPDNRLIPHLERLGFPIERWRKMHDSTQEVVFITTLGNKVIAYELNDTEKRKKSKEVTLKERNRLQMNGRLQASGSELLHTAQFLINCAIYGSETLRDCRIVNSLHDELVVEAPRRLVREVCTMLRKTMTEHPRIVELMSWEDRGVKQNIPLFVEIEIGHRWGEFMMSEQEWWASNGEKGAQNDKMDLEQ